MTFRELDFGRNLILLTQHKTGVDIELPMVPDVKAALKQYLEEERACYDSPYVFLRIVPLTAISLCRQSPRSSGLPLWQLELIRRDANRAHMLSGRPWQVPWSMTTSLMRR